MMTRKLGCIEKIAGQLDSKGSGHWFEDLRSGSSLQYASGIYSGTVLDSRMECTICTPVEPSRGKLGGKGWWEHSYCITGQGFY